MRLHLPLLSLAVVLGSLAGSGCATEKIFYNVNIAATEPTEATDTPGLWHDKERKTPERPRPIPVRDVLIYFELVKPDGTRSPVESAARTSRDGWTFFRGKLEVEKDWKFSLRTKKAGYTNFERTLTIAEAKNSTMTFVLKALDPAAKAAEDAARAKSEEAHQATARDDEGSRPPVDRPPAPRHD